MQPTDIQNQSELTADYLENIVGYYDIVTRSHWSGYEKEFRVNGSGYIVNMFRFHYDFAVWFTRYYPNAFATIANQFQISSPYSRELSDCINVLLGYRSV